VEALGHRNAILAHDVPEHREVLGDAGAYFGYRDVADLAKGLAALIADPCRIERYRDAAGRRVADRFGWDAVTQSYETFFETILGRQNRP
jgi:glycosyltransferase involved in cell wall biosynthesis